jgi:hypothetical protein
VGSGLKKKITQNMKLNGWDVFGGNSKKYLPLTFLEGDNSVRFVPFKISLKVWRYKSQLALSARHLSKNPFVFSVDREELRNVYRIKLLFTGG